MLNTEQKASTETPSLQDLLKRLGLSGNNIDPTDLILYLDYDDCLEASTQRGLTGEQKQILFDLNELTNGGVIITTNSDGRTVERELPNFPIISEFATVFRRIVPGRPIFYKHEKPECSAAFEAACQYANDNGIRLTESADDLLASAAPSIKPELKEMGLCFVFGQHASMKDAAIEMANKAFASGAFDKDQFEIEIGKDAVEIKIKDATKADVIEDMKRFEHLKNRRTLVAMGDSGSDLEVMQAVGKGVVVGNAIPDSELHDVNYVRLSSENNDFSESWDLLRLLRDTYAQLTQAPRPTAPAQAAP